MMMNLKTLKYIFEARDQNENRLFKYCTFEWILDLLKDGVVHSYDTSTDEDKDDGKKWIALTTKRSSTINQYVEEYGPIEVTFDKELLKINNELYIIRFDPEWLDLRPSIMKFTTKGNYTSTKDYFKKHYKDVNWKNTDNFSKRFFNEYLKDDTLNVDMLLTDHTVDDIENYIYDHNYTPFRNYLKSLGDENELVICRSPLKLVNDAILQIVVPRRYKDKISKYETDYKIRYE